MGCLFILLTLLISLADASDITILAPVDGSSVKSKDIIIIGKAQYNVKEVEIKGIAGDTLKVKTRKNGVFSAKVTLSGNDSNISITGDDGSSANINLKVNGSGADKFTYHPDEDEVADCTATCHTENSKDYSVQPASTVCYECHDANNDKEYVHGPVNMGICVACHMPHGSKNSSFLLASKETLCQGCHEELMTTHPDTKSKICIDCHDPHSSDKEFHMK
jgi:predicted CXXCH cytochrome family protein